MTDARPARSRTHLSRRAIDVVFVAFASLSVLALVMKWRSDRASDTERRNPVGWRPRDILVTGGSLDRKRIIAFTGPRPSIVFLFRGNCAGCRMNAPAWGDVVSKVGTGAVIHAFTDSRDGATEMPSLRNVDVGIVQSTRMMHDAFPTDAIPATIVIAPDGRIALSLVGVLQTKDVDAVVATARSLAGGRP